MTTAEKYFENKKVKPSSAVLGFIEKNKISGKTEKEIDIMIANATKVRGELLGEGDKFKRWCENRGREVPSDDLVEKMNRDPFGASQTVKKNIPNNPKVWQNWCTYHAGGGRKLV